MQHSPASIRAALLLTNRLVTLDVKPLTAREFWHVAARVDPGELVGLDARDIAEVAAVGAEEAKRLRALLDAATALSFEEERLRDGGIALVSALDDRYPARLRERLGDGCPPFLLVAGPIEWLNGGGLAVVGSADPSDELLATARSAGVAAVAAGWRVVTGLAGGVEAAALTAASDARGGAIGVPPDGIMRASRNSDVRRRVHAGELCLVSPYAPNASSTVSNANGRNKIIYALSDLAFVVAAEHGSGGAWGGANEALEHQFAAVAAWAGTAAPAGNHALIKHGARAVTDVSQLTTLDTTLTAPPSQDSLFSLE